MHFCVCRVHEINVYINLQLQDVETVLPDLMICHFAVQVHEFVLSSSHTIHQPKQNNSDGFLKTVPFHPVETKQKLRPF